MISEVELSCFKCFESLRLPLARLTLLTGLNACGKSTVMQALGLLHQTMIDDASSQELLLDGSLLRLGSAFDVIDQVRGRSKIGIGVATDQARYVWRFETADRSSMSMALTELEWKEADHQTKTEYIQRNTAILQQLVPQRILRSSTSLQGVVTILEEMIYISAERSGPREAYVLTPYKYGKDVGIYGERTPAVIHLNSDAPVLDGLRLPRAPAILARQVEAWMDWFFPGAGLSVNEVPRACLVSLAIRTDPASEFMRPQNVGYGLTHILPILTACLAASEGALVLVENPEVHLHPAGQARMGEFLARAAASGVQLIVETHSDHVLNGVRRAVKEQHLASDDVAIRFFTRRPDGPRQDAQVISPTINTLGAIDHWPQGFFDQIEKDMAYLVGWDA